MTGRSECFSLQMSDIILLLLSLLAITSEATAASDRMLEVSFKVPAEKLSLIQKLVDKLNENVTDEMMRICECTCKPPWSTTEGWL